MHPTNDSALTEMLSGEPSVVNRNTSLSLSDDDHESDLEQESFLTEALSEILTCPSTGTIRRDTSCSKDYTCDLT